MKTPITILLLFSFTSVLQYIEGAKILAVIPFPGKSHNIFIRAIIDKLAARGHEVTIYASLLSGKNITNIKEVELKNSLSTEFMKSIDFNFIREISTAPIFGPPGFLFMSLQITNSAMNDSVLQELIKSDEKYDVVLLETHFGQESLIAFGYKFQAPVVSLHTLPTNLCVDEYIGNPFGVPYIPSFELRYSEKMTFFQRAHNTLRTFIYLAATYLYYLPKQDSIMRSYFKFPGSENMPPIVDMLQNISLVVANTQFSIDIPRPWVPNVIAAGGAHISPDRKPLPQDLKEFIENSKNGIIYVSFGTVVPSDQMPENMKQGLVKAFGKLKQNVLWKLAVDSFPGLPKNVRISRWLPQHDILDHPKCLAFVTHGGFLSHEEATYFGVPLIGVPFFGDQFINTHRAVTRGFGVYLDSENITEESVLWAVNEVVSKPTYQENAKKYSKIFHDTPVPPAENAAYWIEYIIRHKGAPHLRTEGRNLPYYKYLLLDVIAFLALVIGLIVYIVYKMIKFICKKTIYKRTRSRKVTASKKKR